MKKYQLIYMMSFLLIAFLYSCDKDENGGAGDIYGKWEATAFISIESAGYPKNNNYNPVIEFKNDGRYSLKLDRNSCSGSFSLKGENNIDIYAAGCTKICCDSKFSQKFIAMLPQVINYSNEGNKLKLNVSGWGWIEMKAVNNQELMSLLVVSHSMTLSHTMT